MQTAGTVFIQKVKSRGAPLPTNQPSIVSPHPIQAVQVKHAEGTFVDHRGALQLWNDDALARQGVETVGHRGPYDTEDLYLESGVQCEAHRPKAL